MQKLNAWQAIVKALETENVKYVFGLPGSSKMLYNALYESDKVEDILVRHQVSGVFMAIAYSLLTGNHGVCFGGPGPGMTNLMSGILEAKATCSPLIILSCSVSTEVSGLPGFQETEQLEMVKPITKWAYKIDNPKRTPWVIRRAFAISKNGKPGPVYIEIPKDISTTNTDMPEYERSMYSIKSTGLEEDFDDATEMIKDAEKPILICGGGTILSRAFEEVKIISERFKIPVFTTLSGRGIISEKEPLALGLTGLYFNELGRNIYDEADLLITVGTRNEQFETLNWNAFPEDAKLIHIDIDSFEIQRNWNPDKAILGDARNILSRLINKLSKDGYRVQDNWVKDIIEQKKNYLKNIDEKYNDKDIYNTRKIIFKANKIFGDNTILVNENGSQDIWSYNSLYYQVGENNCVAPGNQTCMGFGVAGAIGAKLAYPNKNVICITGDGAFQMLMKELPTSMQYNAPITYIVLNNSALGWIKFSQKASCEGRFISSTFSSQPKFEEIANANNCYGERVSASDQIEGALKRALEANKNGQTSVLNFIVEDWEDVPNGLKKYYGL